MKCGSNYERLLEAVVNSALFGTEAFAGSGSMGYPAAYRLAFRELGLSIGLSAAVNLQKLIRECPGSFQRDGHLRQQVEDLKRYMPLRRAIEDFWIDGGNREASTWKEHREINMVMLATSIAPEEFLMI